MAVRTALIDAWLEVVDTIRASDLHLIPDLPPLVRVNGELAPIANTDPLTSADVDKIGAALMGDLAEGLELEGDVDLSFAWRDKHRFRVNAYRQVTGLAIALRAIPREVPTLDQLGVPDVVRQLIAAPSGLVIVTGPTGAGKSTTLAAMIDQINRDRRCHILTLEDPVEYVFQHRSSMVTQREVGVDAVSFTQGLRAALREDPDVLLVGEMRDLDSIQTTISIAETGHLVLATLHTNDTSQAIDRIVDVFPAERRSQIQVQLSSTLQGVIFQRLLPSTDGVHMVAAFEVMMANNAVRNLVREGRSRQLRNVVATSTGEGMQTFEQHLTQLVAEGLVDRDVAIAASLYPKEVGTARTAAAKR